MMLDQVKGVEVAGVVSESADKGFDKTMFWKGLSNPCEGIIARLREHAAVVCPVSDRRRIQAAVEKGVLSGSLSKYTQFGLNNGERSLDLETAEWILDVAEHGYSEPYWPDHSFEEVVQHGLVSAIAEKAYPAEVFFELIKWAQQVGHLPSEDLVLHEDLTSGWVAPLHTDWHSLETIRNHLIFSSVIGNQNPRQGTVLSVVDSTGEVRYTPLFLGDMYLLDPAKPHSLHPYLSGRDYGGYLPDTDPLGKQAYHQVFIPRHWVEDSHIALILEVLLAVAFKCSGRPD